MPIAPPKHQQSKLAGATRHIVPDERAYKRWYGLAVWVKHLRPSTMYRDRYTCRMCGRNWANETSRIVVDHVKPHRGNWSLFRDPENLQCLCDHPCHARYKQRMEQGL